MFLNCPGVCATAGVAASAALATATEASASFMNPLRWLDIFSLPADLSSPFLRRPLMVVGDEFFGRSWIAERRSVRVCPLYSWRKITWQQPSGGDSLFAFAPKHRDFEDKCNRQLLAKGDDVRFGSKADISACIGHGRVRLECPLRANSGHRSPITRSSMLSHQLGRHTSVLGLAHCRMSA